MSIYAYICKGYREHAVFNSLLIIAFACLYEDRYVDHDGEQRMVIDGAELQFLWDNR